MTLSRSVLIPLTASVLALLAGCGGGSLTKAELISQADAICAETEKKIDALGTPETPADLKEFAGKAATAAKEQVDKLKALEPPDEVKADWDKALGLLDQQVGLADQLAESADDQAKLQEIISKGDELNTESDRLAENIGLKECGS